MERLISERLQSLRSVQILGQKIQDMQSFEKEQAVDTIMHTCKTGIVLVDIANAVAHITGVCEYF